MSEHNKCHCGAPAPWMVRVVPLGEGSVLAVMAEDSWAACDEHLDVAAANLLNRNFMDGKVLTLRRENIE